MSFKWILVFSVLLTIFFSCTSEKGKECITNLDCENGLVCQDGVCTESGSVADTDNISLDDSDTTGMPDNSNVLPDNNNTEPDDKEVDDENQQDDVVEDKDTGDNQDDVDPDDPEEEDDSEIIDEVDEVDEEVQDEDNFVPTPCDPNPCEEIIASDGTCTIVGEDFKCGCSDGYYWLKGECKDLNECLDSFYNDCDENADCENVTGSYNCVCHTNYSGDGTECTADTQSVACTNTKPEHSSWNAANADGMISQTWNGTAWDPADDTCLWDCDEHYSKDGDTCDPEVIVFTCNDKPEIGTEWNSVSSYERTWNGTEFVPAETVTEYNETPLETACRYKCAENYEWNETECVAQTKTFNCYTKPLIGTKWNTVSSYEQTWDGTNWVPASTTTEYNEAPSETACRYICDDHYTWNGSICAADTKTFTCADKPAVGTIWNKVSTYEQTWNGTGWMPVETTTEYGKIASTTSCLYTCDVNYSWNGTICQADTRIFNCADKPAIGTDWNTVSNYEQTWTGTEWLPADTETEYNTESSNEICRYQCAENYTWTGTSCEADTRTFTCADKPAVGTEWNTVSSYEQTWNGMEWLPADSVTEHSTVASTEICRFKCIENYEWNGASCVGATRTFNCPEKPGTGTAWNTVSSYEQTWNGSAWIPADDNNTDYDTTGDDQSCRFECLSNFTWNGTSCEGTTQEDQDCTGLPLNASWNTVSQIDQSWNGSGWVPSTTGVYNTVASTTECRFICDSSYNWSGASCNYCNTDTHCGPSCSSCSGNTPKCTSTSPHCVECLTDDDCEENYICNGSNVCEETFYCGDGIIQYSDHSPDAGIIVQLHMDENTGSTTADTSGNDRTASLSNTAWTTNGKYENALVFNGTTSFAVIGGGYTPPTNNFTMEAWVKTNDTHEIDPESTSGTGGTSGQKELFGANHGGTNAGAGISVGTNGISVYEHGDSYMPALAVYSGYIGTGWNHIAVTYTNKKPRIYLNGNLVRTGLTSPRDTVSAPTMIGKGSYGLFNGTVDEVRIYNTALSAAQIQSHFYCDDYNNSNGDGCDATCHVEDNYDCEGEPSDCTDNFALCTQKIAEFNYDFSSAQGWPVTNYWYISDGAIKSDSDYDDWTNTIISPSHDLSSCAGQNIRIRVSSFNNLEEGYDKLYIDVPGESCEVPYNGGTFTEYYCELPESAKVNSFTTTFKVTTDANTLEGSARFDWIIIERY